MHNETSFTDLLKHLRDDSTALIRQEVALAKAELRENAKEAGKNVGLLTVGGLVAFVALIMFLIGCAKLVAVFLVAVDLSPEVAELLGYGLVAVIVGVGAAATIAKALQALKEEPLLPEKTIETLKEDKQWVQAKIH